MDADSSYGGSDTAQDSTSAQDNNSSMETTHEISTAFPTSKSNEENNSFYHKNEITLPVNYDETDATRNETKSKLPHYLSTVNLNINDSLENHSNLEELSKKYHSTENLNVLETPKSGKRSMMVGVENPAFQGEDEMDDEDVIRDDDVVLRESKGLSRDDESTKIEGNGTVRSSFGDNKNFNGCDLSLTSPTKTEDSTPEAVNLELINLKPNGNDLNGPYENGKGIPVKKERDVERANPYDEYFVPVHEHKKYMR